jgi:ribosome maturation factor RimP
MDIVQEVEKLVEPVLKEAGIELVHVEYHTEMQGWVLRFYLDKEGGFGLNDCADWNDRLGELIEASNIIHGRYSLEISSPGLNRPIKKEADFARFAGMEAVIKLKEPLRGQRNFHGKLLSVTNGILEFFDRTSARVNIPIDQILSAKLDVPMDLKD